MFFESAVIVIIISILSIGFLRQKKVTYAKATIPIVLIPLYNILIVGFSEIIGKYIPDLWNTIIIGGYFIFLLLSMVLILKEAKKFESKRRQKLFLFAVGIFLFLLIYVLAKANIV